LKRIRSILIFLAACAVAFAGCVQAPGLASEWQAASPLESTELGGAGFTPGPASTIPPRGQAHAAIFHSPEVAVAHYLEGVSQRDIGRILEASAAGMAAEGFDFVVQAERLGDVVAFPQFLAPSDDEFYAGINQLRIASQLLQQVKMLTYRLLAGDVVDDGATYIEADPDAVADLQQSLDPARLAGLEVVQVGSPLKTGDPFYKEIAETKAAVYGADDFTERIALLSFEGSHYLAGFSLLRYGETWGVLDQSSPLAELGPLGIPVETTVESFEGMILEE
jgi:hypothetical protein